MVDINYTVIAQVVNFLFLVWILKKFAYKPLLQMMEERKSKIANDLASAEGAKQDADAQRVAAVAELAKARQEAAAIVAAAQSNAKAAADKILADAEAAKEQIIAAGHDEIVIEKKKAMEEIRNQVIELSLIAAGKIVEKKLGTATDKKMATEVVDSIMK